jgi:hypothetical protein
LCTIQFASYRPSGYFSFGFFLLSLCKHFLFTWPQMMVVVVVAAAD